MSTHAVRLARVPAAAAVVPVAAGLLILLARVEILSAGSARNWLLLFAYCALLAVSAIPRTTPGRATLSPVAVTALGAGAFAVVAIAPWQTNVVTPWRLSGLALALLAAVAEEAFFRRLLFDRLLPLGAVAAVVGSAVVFALVHVPLYGTSVLWLDLGAGALLSWQRVATGSWASPAITHAFANALAVLR